ncbi:MAG TPA: AMP-binding protein [Kofleriaceae bacterium]|nr:AMP-binding protein [Kofleriaceae bacterium]
MAGPDASTHLVDDEALARARDRLAEALRASGMQAGERVAILCGTRPEMIAAREATAALGLVAAPLDPRLTAPEVAYSLAHARPRALLVEPGREPAAAAALDRMLPIRRPELVPLAPVPAGPGGAGRARPPARGVAPDTIGATLLYTSGTTGRAKGCMRSAEKEAARAAELVATYRIAPEDVHLVACPLAYSAPGILTRAGRAVGARTALLPRFSADQFLDVVAATRASLFFLVPTQLQRLLALPAELRRRADLAAVRAVIVAGAPLAPALRRAAVDWLGEGRLWEFYGSSETGTITVLRPEEQLAHADSVGRPAAGVELRVEPTAGAEEGAGEIWVRSPTVMSGYWNPVTQEVEWPGTAEGFVTVGDLGRLDDAGYLHLIDRLHDTIISGGVNVYPAEVERALVEHPEVAGAVVFGVADDEWGQRVAALVVRAHGSTVTAEELRAFAGGRLARHKVPRQIAFVAPDDLPRTSSGKPLRRAASALLRRLDPPPS